jgi:hypothetical protein
MPARRLGRLLGTALALVALTALASGTLGPGSDDDMHTDDYDWGAKFVSVVIDVPVASGATAGTGA